MKILKLVLLYTLIVFGGEIKLEEKLTKEQTINSITLNKSTIQSIKNRFGFSLEKYKVKDNYKEKLYDTKELCFEDTRKGIFLLVTSSAIPSNFTLIDIFNISSTKPENIVGLKCHQESITFQTRNYLGYTRVQIIDSFGDGYEKSFENGFDYLSYSIEKEAHAMYQGQLRVLYPNKGISFKFKNNRVVSYTVNALVEYGAFIKKSNKESIKYKCLTDKEQKRILMYFEEQYSDVKSFIECGKNKNGLEKYVCQNDELLLMFKLLSQAYIASYENATKSQVDHNTFIKEYGLPKTNGDWMLKSYIKNSKVDIEHLCNDLKLETNEQSGYDIYTKENIQKLRYIPKYSDYLTKNKYRLSNQPLIQKEFGRLYRTRLKQALKEKKPEFAGKYIIAEWGCDEGKNKCTTGGIIDASTGKATPFPLKYYAHNGAKEIIYRLDSSLIIFAGDFELEDGTKKTNQVRFYEVKDGEFLFLKSTVYKK